MDKRVDTCAANLEAEASAIAQLAPAVRRAGARAAIALCTADLHRLAMQCQALTRRVRSVSARTSALAAAVGLPLAMHGAHMASLTRGTAASADTAAAKQHTAPPVCVRSWNRLVSVYPVCSAADASALITKAADAVVTVPELADDTSPLDGGGWVVHSKSRHPVTATIESLVSKARLQLMYELPDFMRDLPAVKAQISRLETVLSPPLNFHVLVSEPLSSLAIRHKTLGVQTRSLKGGPTDDASRRRVEITTTEMSLVSDPGDSGTNEHYRELIERVDAMLNELPQHRHVWKHLLGDGSEKGGAMPEASATSTTASVDFARQATDAELVRLGTHTIEYLAAMRARTEQARKDGGTLAANFGNSAGNTTRTEAAARVAAATLIDAATAVAADALDAAFVIAKPPTHHAVGNAARCRGRSPQNLPFGFCHLNGISAAAAAVLETHSGAKVAILDVDVHHGNGNEDTWYESPDVLHINLSQAGLWPGRIGQHMHADPAHVGAGAGRGFNFNYPMEVAEGDAAYVWALLEHVIPRLVNFQPKVLFVACGFDAMEGDPYANMRLSPTWFGWMAARLREEGIAPLVFNMEGGYNPETCATATKLTIDGLNGTVDSTTFLDTMGLTPSKDCDTANIVTARDTSIDPRGLYRRAIGKVAAEPTPRFVGHLAEVERWQNSAVAEVSE